MDILKDLAYHISLMTGERVEIEPSVADIKTDHFIISARSLWLEPDGTMLPQEYTYVEDGKRIDGYKTALPVRVVFVSRGTGETWRSEILKKTKEYAKRLHHMFKLPIIGSKLTGKALEKVESKISNIDELNINDIHGLAFYVELTRSQADDVVFQMQRDKYNKNYEVQQVWDGHIIIEEGQEVL